MRPCASCPTRVSTVAFHMGDTSIGAFSTPTQKVAYTVTASGTAAGGVIWAQVRWCSRGGRFSEAVWYEGANKLLAGRHAHHLLASEVRLCGPIASLIAPLVGTASWQPPSISA